jgi:hypothetical protein
LLFQKPLLVQYLIFAECLLFWGGRLRSTHID